MASEKSSSGTDSAPRPTTWFGLKGNRSPYNSETPPPAAHVSSDPAMVGRRFGWVEIVSPERRWKQGWRECRVLGRCTGCGTESWYYLANLTRGLSRGCQSCSKPKRVPLWLEKRMTAARARCTNPKDAGWPNYGARGIEFRFASVQDACIWVMENLGLDRSREIDREDNDGHYEAGNLRYATKAEQMRNQRRSKIRQIPNWESPYSPVTTARLLRAGYSEDEIMAMAALAVAERRKNWRGIAARFASMTS